jgi:hypothetical protein
VVATNTPSGTDVHAVAPTTDAPTTGAPVPADFHDAAGRFSITIEPGWYRSNGPLAWWLYSPHELLSLATEPALTAPHAAANEAACPSEIPKVAVDRIGADGAYVWLGEHRAGGSSHGDSPRPASFAAADWRPLCPLPGGMSAAGLDFVDAGRAFTVSVVFGPDVTAGRRAEVYRMLDSLAFEP